MLQVSWFEGGWCCVLDFRCMEGIMPKFRLSSTILSRSCVDLHQNGQDITAEDTNNDSKRYSSCNCRKPDVVHWKTKVWMLFSDSKNQNDTYWNRKHWWCGIGTICRLNPQLDFLTSNGGFYSCRIFYSDSCPQSVNSPLAVTEFLLEARHLRTSLGTSSVIFSSLVLTYEWSTLFQI